MKKIAFMAIMTIALFLAAPFSSDAGRSHGYGGKGVQIRISWPSRVLWGLARPSCL